MRRYVLVFALLNLLDCATAGSGSSSNIAPLNVLVGTVEDTVAIQRTADSTYFNVTAVVFNKDTRPVKVQSCGPPLQIDINGAWTTVGATNCVKPGMTPVAVGDSLVVPVTAFGYTKPDTYPRLNPLMGPGRYRLLFGVGRADVRGPPTQGNPSTTFIVR
jgi:hypothetical protein